MEQLKSLLKTVISWINTKGFTALTALGIGLFLWSMGAKIFAGVAFGVFFTRDWDILKDLFRTFWRK